MYKKNLLDKAREASNNSYCPYSSFPVGAALLTHDDKIFTGCNAENASYSLCICAERTAMGAAVSAGYRKFKAIAVFAKKVSPCNPCGACLQFMSEFGDMEIILESEDKKIQTRHLNEFLPHNFNLDSFKKKLEEEANKG